MSSKDVDFRAWLDESGWQALWPEGVDAVVLDRVDSTMAEAARRAPPERPTWIMARAQSAARGRRGRPWQHPTGNFAATLVFRSDRPAQEAALTSFVAAVALYETLAAVTGREALTLKWPNDVLLNKRKVAGILLESAGQGDRVDWLSVGIGINLASAPAPETLEPGALPPIALDEVERRIPLFEGADAQQEILVHLAHAFALQMRLWDEFGFDVIRMAWQRHHGARKGSRMTARTPRETIAGTFERLDDDGCLVLNTEDGARRIAAAEVFFDEG